MRFALASCIEAFAPKFEPTPHQEAAHGNSGGNLSLRNTCNAAGMGHEATSGDESGTNRAQRISPECLGSAAAVRQWAARDRPPS